MAPYETFGPSVRWEVGTWDLLLTVPRALFRGGVRLWAFGFSLPLGVLGVARAAAAVGATKTAWGVLGLDLHVVGGGTTAQHDAGHPLDR